MGVSITISICVYLDYICVHEFTLIGPDYFYIQHVLLTANLLSNTN